MHKNNSMQYYRFDAHVYGLAGGTVVGCNPGFYHGQKACGERLQTFSQQQLWHHLGILRWCLITLATLTTSLMFSISQAHKLLSAVITVVHLGPAEGSLPVCVHRFSLFWHKTNTSEGHRGLSARQANLPLTALERKRSLRGGGVNEND